MKNVCNIVNKYCQLCCFIFISMLIGSSLDAQDSVSAYSQPSHQKWLQIVSPTQSVSYSFWVDQMESYSVSVSSVMKTLGLQLTDPKGAVFVFGQPDSVAFQSLISPDPLLVPDAPGANYHVDLENPVVGQWTLQVTAPAAFVSPLSLPVRISFNNQVGSVLFGGGGSSPVGNPVSFSVAVMDGTAKAGNLQINAMLYRLGDTTVSPIQVAFTDDGQGADYASGDSIYSAYIVPNQPGNYMLQVELSGDASTGHFQRSTATGFKVAAKTASITGNFTIKPRVGLPK